MGGKGQLDEKRRGKRKLLIALVPEQSVASVARSIITRAHEDEKVEKGKTKKMVFKKKVRFVASFFGENLMGSVNYVKFFLPLVRC